MVNPAIQNLYQSQKVFFHSGKTREIGFRIDALKKLQETIFAHEKDICAAVFADLHKEETDAYATEISGIYDEIKNAVSNIRDWAAREKVPTPGFLMPSKSYIYKEPFGVTLIIAPWNYPFMLLMTPVVGAISAGCTAILKPSPYTPNVALTTEEMITEFFEPEYLATVQGSRKVNEVLLDQRFDFIFYTGSPQVGKVVMKAAAEHLTPVVLELGGKNPCIIDKDANLDITAARVAFGKCVNAGQTCLAPDYIFIHESVKEDFIRKLGETITKMYGHEPEQSPYFSRIVNHQAFDRLEKLLQNGRIRFGGKTNRESRYISPTIIDEIKPEYPVMQEEIFGPILPVLTFGEISEVEKYLNTHEKPLAFYYFGRKSKAKETIRRTTSGGGCINDTLMHFVNHNLPFGGVGNSGLGKYHGVHSFLAFSNQRAIVCSPSWYDIPLEYAPFKYFKLIRKLM